MSDSLSRLALRIIFGLLLSGAATPAGADTIQVGDPGTPADLPHAVYQAHDHGARDITIAPGVYDLPTMNHQDTFFLDHWKDTTIHAQGVTLIFEELGKRPVHFYSCKNVTWDGGTLLFAHPSFTQGRIKSIGSDAKGSYCDWQVDAGYDAKIDPTKITYDVVDQATCVLKVDTGDWTPASYEKTGESLFRLRYPAGRGGGFAVNDWLVTRAPAGNTILHMDGCETCTIQEVTLQNAGFAAFFETGGVGGNHYFHCKLQPGPRPQGAMENELVGCGADGFHSTETETGPDIEDCVFTGVFLDDCIAIHGGFDRVIKAEGSSLTLASPHPAPKIGQPLRIANMDGFFAQATCTAVYPADGKVSVTLDQNLQIPIDHSEDSDDKKGTKASCPNYCGRGYKILRCRLGDTRSRGILVKADNGLISGCVIEGCGMSGVSIGPEFWWNEAGYCWNVMVSNNKFVGCNKNNGDQAAAWIHGDGAMGNRNITIKSNTFDTCYGQYIIRSDWADGVAITDNNVVKGFEVKLGSPGHVVWVMHSKNVKLFNNTVSDQGPFAGDLVGLDSSVNTTDVQNTGPESIQIR